jgi:adenosine/AMP kinase
MSREFKELTINRLFRMNGNDYVKQSTRTARMLSTGRVFYIGASDVVHPIAW